MHLNASFASADLFGFENALAHPSLERQTALITSGPLTALVP